MSACRRPRREAGQSIDCYRCCCSRLALCAGIWETRYCCIITTGSQTVVLFSFSMPIQERPGFHHSFLTPLSGGLQQSRMSETEVPQPGPARLKPNAGPDQWLEAAKKCKYLSEPHMKQLCEIVKEYMMEGTLVPEGLRRRVLLMNPARVQYSAGVDARYDLWRYSWPVLRCPGVVSSGRRNAGRV